jgi:hypothetical protein
MKNENFYTCNIQYRYRCWYCTVQALVVLVCDLKLMPFLISILLFHTDTTNLEVAFFSLVSNLQTSGPFSIMFDPATDLSFYLVTSVKL